jgi:hypothetical protein
MDNFDLRKYLAEGRLLKENSLVKSESTFKNILPLDFLQYATSDVDVKNDRDKQIFQVSLKIPKGAEVIDQKKTVDEVSKFLKDKYGKAKYPSYVQPGEYITFDVKEEGDNFIVIAELALIYPESQY